MSTYSVLGMDCADCVAKVERGVARLAGVDQVQVNLITGKMNITGTVTADALRARVEALGYKLGEVPAIEGAEALPTLAMPDPSAPQPDATMTREPRGTGVAGFVEYLLHEPETRLALIGGGLIGLAVIASVLRASPIVTQALLAAAVAIAGWPAAHKGLNTLRINHEFSIDLLMVVAAVGAFLIGDMLEGATVVFLYAIGEALEGFSIDRARSSLRSLVALAPVRAIRLTDGRPEEVPAGTLKPGDTIRVRPGDQVPADCVVKTGEGDVNQAAITGESLPVIKRPGDNLLAGTINGTAAFEAIVERAAADSTLSRIIHLVEEAQGQRAPTQRLIEQVARVYTPLIFLGATLIALVPPLFGAPFWSTPAEQGWLYRALSLLVIACPCALVISAPVTVLSAITAAARQGVLIKGGAYLEALGQIRTVAFDKTGTLTKGELAVQSYQAVGCGMASDGTPAHPDHQPTQCADCAEVLALAAALEQSSTHPLARAVVAEAAARGVADRYTAEAVQNLPGKGVQGIVNGQRVIIGSHAYFDAEFPHTAAVHAKVQAQEAAGNTTLLINVDQTVAGYLSATDSVRESSQPVIQSLRAMGVAVAMLSGDNHTAAQQVADAVGIDQTHAGLLPAEKLTLIRRIGAAHGPVAMVGDGINDTPALAAASVGIAMGGAGSAQAIEAADVVLMADSLAQLPYAMRLARFARRLIGQNIAISFGTKALFFALAIEGRGSLWLAIAADVGVSLLVTLNGMRALRSR